MNLKSQVTYFYMFWFMIKDANWRSGMDFAFRIIFAMWTLLSLRAKCEFKKLHLNFKISEETKILLK